MNPEVQASSDNEVTGSTDEDHVKDAVESSGKSLQRGSWVQINFVTILKKLFHSQTSTTFRNVS